MLLLDQLVAVSTTICGIEHLDPIRKDISVVWSVLLVLDRGTEGGMAKGDDPTIWRVDDALWAELQPLLVVNKPRRPLC